MESEEARPKPLESETVQSDQQVADNPKETGSAAMATDSLDSTVQSEDKGGEGVLDGSHDVTKEGRGEEVGEASGEGGGDEVMVGTCGEMKENEEMASHAEVKEKIAAGVKEEGEVVEGGSGELVEGGSGEMVSSEEMGKENTDVLTSVLVSEECSEVLPTSAQATPTTDMLPQLPAEPLLQAIPVQDSETTPQATPLPTETIHQPMPPQAGTTTQATPLQTGTTPPVAESTAIDQQLVGMDAIEDSGGKGVCGEGEGEGGEGGGVVSEGMEMGGEEEAEMEVEENVATQQDLAGPGKGWSVGVASNLVTLHSAGTEGGVSAGGSDEVASEGGKREEDRVASGEEGASRHREGEGAENFVSDSEQEAKEEESE